MENAKANLYRCGSTGDSESVEKSSFTILEELSVSWQDLTDEDLVPYAKSLGINPENESDLLWIAEEALLADLPIPWIAVEDQSGRIFYYNKRTNRSLWEHPLDRYYKSLVKKQRLRKFCTSEMTNKQSKSLNSLRFLGEQISFFTENEKNSGKSSPNNNQLTLSSLGDEKDDEVDSVQFELDEDAFNGITLEDDDEEEEKTIDVTEGGPCDVKRFEEVYSVDLKAKPKDTNGSERNGRAKASLNRLQSFLNDESSEENFSEAGIESDPFASRVDDLFVPAKVNLASDVSSKTNAGLARSRLSVQLESLDEEPENSSSRNERPKSALQRRTSTERKITEKAQNAPLPKLHKQENELGNFQAMSSEFRREIDQFKEEIRATIKNEENVLTKKYDLDYSEFSKKLEQLNQDFEKLQSLTREHNKLSSTSMDERKIYELTEKVESLGDRVNRIENTTKERNVDGSHSKFDVLEADLKKYGSEFIEFRKENDLTLRALRKQLLEVTNSSDTVESRCNKLEKNATQVSHEVQNISGTCTELEKNLQKVKNFGETQDQKWSKTVQGIRERLQEDLKSLQDFLKESNEKTEDRQSAIIKDTQMNQRKIQELEKKLEIFQEKLDNLQVSKSTPSNKNSPSAQDEMKNENVEKRLETVEGSLKMILTKLDNLKEKNRTSFKQTPNRRFEESEGSSYRDTGSSSQESKRLNKNEKLRAFRRKKRWPISTERLPSFSYFNDSYEISPLLDFRSRKKVFSSSSTSLLAMIRRTIRLLKNETSDMDSLGNYRFISDISSNVLRKESDDNTIRKLTQIRYDIDDKLKKLDSLIRR